MHHTRPMSATVQPQTEPSEATPLQDTTNVRCLKTPKHHHSPTTSQHTPLMPGVRAPAPTPVGGAAPARLLKPSDLQLGTTPTQLPTTTPGVRKIQSQLSQLDRTPHPAQFLQGTKERQGHVRQATPEGRWQLHDTDDQTELTPLAAPVVSPPAADAPPTHVKSVVVTKQRPDAGSRVVFDDEGEAVEDDGSNRVLLRGVPPPSGKHVRFDQHASSV